MNKLKELSHETGVTDFRKALIDMAVRVSVLHTVTLNEEGYKFSIFVCNAFKICRSRHEFIENYMIVENYNKYAVEIEELIKSNIGSVNHD